MRFVSFHLLKFGAFTDHVLQFGDAVGRLHLVYGANESGKSTTLRAVGDLLFGFGTQTPDGFLHGPTALRVGAKVATDDGRALEFYRRKGRTKTLLDAAGKAIVGDPLTPLLGAVDRSSFERLLGLDHERLRRGGEELLKEGGSVAMGLFQAGAGVASVRQVLERLTADADALYRPRGSTQSINVGLKRWAEERSKIHQSSTSGEAYHRLDVQLREVEKQLDSHEQCMVQLQTRRRQRERIRSNLGPLAVRRSLLDEIEELRSVPRLSEETSRRRLDAEEQLHRATAKLEQTVARDAERRAEHEALRVPVALIAATSRIGQLHKTLNVVANAVDDLPKREAQELELRSRVERLLHDAALRVPVAEAEQHLPAAPEVQLIRRLADERERLAARRTELSSNRVDLEGELKVTQNALEAIPEPRNPALLERAIKQALALGSVEQRLSELEQDAGQQQRNIEQRLAALPLFGGSVDRLRALQTPVEATVARFAEEWQQCTVALRDAEQRLAEAVEAKAVAGEQLERIRQGGELATDEAVAQARERREAGWGLIRRAYIDGSEDVSEELIHFDPTAALPAAYEASVRGADELGDRRQAEATRVARFEHALAQLQKCKQTEASWMQRVQVARTRLVEQKNDWTKQWAPLEVEPLPPAEMRDWLRERAAIVEAATRAASAVALWEAERAKLNDAQQRLLHALLEIGQTATEQKTLRNTLDIAEDTAHRYRQALERRATLGEALAQLHKKREILVVRLRDTERELEQWSVKWAAALRGVGRGAECHPEEVRSLLEVFESLRVELTKWRDLAHRVRAMRADREALEVAVADLVPELAPELGTLPALVAAEHLVGMLEDAKILMNRRQHLEGEIERAKGEMGTARQQIDLARGALGRLCELAGCVSPAELEGIELKANRKHQAERELREVEKQLLANGGGHGLDELVGESEGADAEALAAELQAMEVELREQQERIKVLVERRSELRHELRAMTGSDDAAEGAQRAELLVGRLKEDTEQWLVMKVAAELLRHGLERYRERNQGPLIGRAGEQFAALTLGRYAKLAVDYDTQDRPILKGVRSDGNEVGVDGMSDGARDQLYLALRLAVLEQFLSKGEKLPVIADDLLVHFDDERSSAALAALGELAQRTQVLYFTHHATVVELARKQLGAQRLVVHQLP